MSPMLPRWKERRPPRLAGHQSCMVQAALLIALMITTRTARAASPTDDDNSGEAANVQLPVPFLSSEMEDGASSATARPTEGRSLTATAAEGAAAASLWRSRLHRLSSTSVNNQKLSTLLGPILSYEVGPIVPPPLQWQGSGGLRIGRILYGRIGPNAEGGQVWLQSA